MRIQLVQQNYRVGDIPSNAHRILEQARQAAAEGIQLVVFPELALTGYPPEDLLLRPSLKERLEAALALLEQSPLPILFGSPWWLDGQLVNAAIYLAPGSAPRIYAKQALPNYRLFDEPRYFQPGTEPLVIELQGMKLGVSVCEDLWQPEVAAQARAAGAEVLLNLSASPYRMQKLQQRLQVCQARTAETGLPILYCNLVGGQDEFVFDGGSLAVDGNGNCLGLAPQFAEGVLTVEVLQQAGGIILQVLSATAEPMPLEQELYQALVLATRDYVTKNGFSGALLGLSGGIDSALTLAIAVDALGADKVSAVMMPFRYTAAISMEDAQLQAQTLGVNYQVLPIEPAFTGFMHILTDAFADAVSSATDTTEENLQARCRGMLLMALSNKGGQIVLTTSNKSEVAVGYSTLYGDMAGGFNVLKDVPKTWVYRLSRYRNQLAGQEWIPQRVIDRPPSAELAEGQLDQNSLPDYDTLDAMLERYVEQDASAEDLVAEGYERETVYRVVKLVDRSEYKRRQGPPGPRLTARGFGKDRRYPITNGWQPGN